MRALRSGVPRFLNWERRSPHERSVGPDFDLNEEINLADCIDSCAWSDDIVVFDSMSADRTHEIARAKGTRVVERAFDNYAAQRNAALTTVPFKHPWVLMVDADERIPPTLPRS